VNAVKRGEVGHRVVEEYVLRGVLALQQVLERTAHLGVLVLSLRSDCPQHFAQG
jgi:hypothetical protein